MIWSGKNMDTQCQSVTFLLVTCLGGIHGYEAVWINLGALRYDYVHCLGREDESTVAWPIIGRFGA